jgi:hypothetical protein
MGWRVASLLSAPFPEVAPPPAISEAEAELEYASTSNSAIQNKKA